jgi:hypothetical protein
MAGLFGNLPAQTQTQKHFYNDNTANLKGTTDDGVNPVWVPEIFSKNVLMRFTRESVVEGITNSDYFGEISSFGDSVRIITEPNITISTYGRGDTMTSATYNDADHTLVLDQAHAYQFEVEDIETQLAHVGWEQLVSNAATYNMKMAYDLNVLAYFEAEMGKILLANKDSSTDPLTDVFIRRKEAASETALAADTTVADAITQIKTDSFRLNNNLNSITAGDIHPLDLVSKMGLYLDKQDVPEEGRYLVVSPEFVEKLTAADSQLINVDYRGGKADFTNGLVAQDVRGFKVFKSNNATPGFLLGGHMSAVATANSIVKTEKLRSQDGFRDKIRGLHVFGRALVRDNALVGAYVTYAQ